MIARVDPVEHAAFEMGKAPGENRHIAQPPNRLQIAKPIFPRQKEINGGSSDTEAKELIVQPTGCPSASRVVTIAIPVAKLPSAFLKSRALK